MPGLYLIEILHQTTTLETSSKAQEALYLIEILHQTTTWSHKVNEAVTLYLIEILHQTTTGLGCVRGLRCCILSKFYIKPQPESKRNGKRSGCILSKFYIKPQPRAHHLMKRMVVSYRNSTSNHNRQLSESNYDEVVSYRNSTSNHNFLDASNRSAMVVSYRNSTSNHNLRVVSQHTSGLYLIEILHQTTTFPCASCAGRSCILSKFYIKPQRAMSICVEEISCILSKFYIKPQLKRQL